MIKDSAYFEFDNEYSYDYDIINCNLSSGMTEEPFVAEVEIIETEIRGRDEPYFQEVKPKPLILDLVFAFKKGWTEESLQRVKRWLRKPYYAKMRFSENPDKIYYCILISDPQISHNGINQGYITCQFRCKSSYAHSHIYLESYDFSKESTNHFVFNNLGDVDVLPIITIKKLEKGKVSILNLSNGKEFGFSELEDNEIVQIDCKRRNIESSLESTPPPIYRYDKLINNYYMSLPYGKNRLKVDGKCFLDMKYEFRFY